MNVAVTAHVHAHAARAWHGSRAPLGTSGETVRPGAVQVQRRQVSCSCIGLLHLVCSCIYKSGIGLRASISELSDCITVYIGSGGSGTFDLQTFDSSTTSVS